MQPSGSQDTQQYYMPAYMYQPHTAEASQVLTNNPYGYYASTLQLGPGQASPPAASPSDIYLPQQFQNALTLSPFPTAYYSQPYADSVSPNYSVPSANASVQTTTNHTNETTGGQGSGRTSPNKFGPKRGGRGGVRAPRPDQQNYSGDSTTGGSSEQLAGGNFVSGHFVNGPAAGAAPNSNAGAESAMIAPRGGYRGRGRGGPRGRGRGRGFRGGGGTYGMFVPPSSTLPPGSDPTAAGAGASGGPQSNASWYNRALVTTVAKLPSADVQAQPLSDMQGRVNPHVMRDLDAQSPRFFVIKSFCEDDVHHSVKYGVWCSTERGNRILDFAFQSQQSNTATPQPVYLFYSVNGSGHFCGIAEMKSRVDYSRKLGNWEQDRWRGIFEVEWIYVKDVPNSELRHIILPNNDNKPVTYSRDTQEVPTALGKVVYQVIHEFHHATSLFDDFDHYEQRERESLSQRTPTSSAAPNTTLGSFLVSSEQAANAPPSDEPAPLAAPTDESAAPAAAGTGAGVDAGAGAGADADAGAGAAVAAAAAEESALPAVTNVSEPQPQHT